MIPERRFRKHPPPVSRLTFTSGFAIFAAEPPLPFLKEPTVRTASLALALSLAPGFCSAQWLPQSAPSGVSVLLSVDCPSAHHCVAGGYATGFFGRAIFTTDGGTTWSPAQTPADSRSPVSVQMLDTSVGFIAGARNTSPCLRTAPQVKPRSAQLTPAATARWERARRIGLDGTSDYTGMFLKTTDGGRNWSAWGALPESTYYLLDLSFLSPDTGFVTTSRSSSVGRAGILKTVNGGLTWQILTIPDSIVSVPAIRFQTAVRGFAAGYQLVDGVITGVVLKTTDAGTHWEKSVFPAVENFTGLSVVDSVTAYLAGVSPMGEGVVYATHNGGTTWELLPFLGDSILLEGVAFAEGSATGVVYGSITQNPWGPYATRTTDGGLTWVTASLPPFSLGTLLLGGLLRDSETGWLVGGNPFGSAVILHTTNGGVTFVEEGSAGDAPAAFGLLQNYPNPFNPATVVEYALPRQGAVRLEILDLLGRRVAILADEELSAGQHTAPWNAAEYSSGVYFCRLSAVGVVRTMRMVLAR